MPRFARLVVKGEEAVYHVMSRTALDGFVFGDLEKEELFKIIKRLSSVYFTEVLGFCLMGNHFHLLIKMKTEAVYSDEEIKKRYQVYYKKEKKAELQEGQIPFYRNKWESLSEYMREIKQDFSRYYNKKHQRKGFFWSERFKSLLVEKGDTLINCLAYIDLNPVRAGIVNRPEDYRWSSIGYHVQSKNKDNFLSLDFGLRELIGMKVKKRFEFYREFLYERGAIENKGAVINEKILKKERSKEFKVSNFDRFHYRTRYFTDSAILGSKEFVSRNYENFKDHFQSTKEKKPRTISGLDGIYSLKRLSAIG